MMGGLNRPTRSSGFLPVGVGTATRSAAKGVYDAAVPMTLNAGIPAERRTTRQLGVLPCRPPAADREEFAAVSLRWFSAVSLHAFTTQRPENADLRPVLPVGGGTSARSAAKGVYHVAVRRTLNTGIPAECRPPPTEKKRGEAFHPPPVRPSGFPLLAIRGRRRARARRAPCRKSRPRRQTSCLDFDTRAGPPASRFPPLQRSRARCAT